MGRTEDRNSSTSELHKGMYTDRSYLTATPQSLRIPAQAGYQPYAWDQMALMQVKGTSMQAR